MRALNLCTTARYPLGCFEKCKCMLRLYIQVAWWNGLNRKLISGWFWQFSVQEYGCVFILWVIHTCCAGVETSRAEVFCSWFVVFIFPGSVSLHLGCPTYSLVLLVVARVRFLSGFTTYGKTRYIFFTKKYTCKRS